MDKEQRSTLQGLRDDQLDVSRHWVDYWFDHSGPDTWQFWVNVFFLISPLILLYFKIDRSKIFIAGFYGFAVHIIFSYFDLILVRWGYISYPYQSIPHLPSNFALDVSLIPVLAILLYQWTYREKKNYYLYFPLLAGGLSFLFKPILLIWDLIHLQRGMNVIHLFLYYLFIFYSAKLLLNFFFFMEKQRSPLSLRRK
ncbi:hypothetical protein GJU40_17000 [Bacillus lacus]|uniref:Uncharacterized protein n=1 Tax=Metabacillus lacus TaxID=1983721 RepID=A0A7X2J3A3_9BACI|nr:CBO0543 family protein [Metabacillus lacus]MRX73843.1 hypothetical protein [Metabacillus lacus]